MCDRFGERLTFSTGYNTTLTLRTHEGSVPSQPALGRALQRFEVEIPTPSLGGLQEGDGNDDGKKGPHFIEDATVSSVLVQKVSTIPENQTLTRRIKDASHYQHSDLYVAFTLEDVNLVCHISECNSFLPRRRSGTY